MEHEKFIIEIEGEAIDDLYSDLISMEVELDDELASMFRLRLPIRQQRNTLWSHLDDERLQIWNRVAIAIGFESGTEAVMDGYITHLKPHFDPDPSQCTLEIWGMDGSVLMDRHERLKAWPNKKDSDIASELFSRYGFTAEVEDTQVIHDEAVSTIIQRETDMQFLKRLALRNSFECYVEGTTGYFRTPQTDATPQPMLTVFPGAETNVNRFSVEVNGLTPANVAMFQVDRLDKEVIEVSVETSRQKPLGETNHASLLPIGMRPGQIYVGMNAATGIPEMTALCQGLFHQVEWFVTGEGEISGNRYGHVLKPRRTVTINGVGETYSGVYYVTHVTHSFTSEGYTQFFRVKRNALT